MVGGSNPPSATTPSPRDLLASAVDRGAQSLAIPDDARLVLAVSGGGDSMALLHGAARLVTTDRRHWQLTVAHLDHGLRAETAAHATFVSDVAADLAIPCETKRVDVAELARREGRSVEDAGRQARYRFLEAVAHPDGLVATAHTVDDAVETVLINLLRGSGLAGARGIPARRGRIVRPLLDERRQRLRSLVDAASIEYVTDASNEDPAYLRNRVRHEVIPLLEQLRPGATDRIAEFSSLAADDDALLDDLARAELERRRIGDEIDWHDPPPPTLARRLLRLAIGHPVPNRQRIDALLEAGSGARGGVVIELGGGRSASVRERRIRIG